MKYQTRFFFFFIAMILFHLSANFAHPITPTIIQDLQLNDYMFGVALAMMQLASFLMSPFWGKINTYISSRLSLLIGCVGYGIAQLWFAFATTELSIIGARLFAGSFVGAIFVSLLTYVINAAKVEDQPKYLTYSATINAVASAFGYLIGGIIGEFSIKGTFLFQSFVLIFTGILFYIVCENDKQYQKVPLDQQFIKDVNPFKAFMDGKKFMTLTFVALFVINILIHFGNTCFDQAFNYYLKDQLGLTSSINGIIKAAVGFVSFISNMTLCIWIMKKTKVERSLSIIMLCSVLSSIATFMIPQISFFILFSIIVYATYSISLPILQNMVATEANPSQKNLVMGFYNATKSLGSIIGSLTAGFIYSTHIKLPFVITALIYGFAFLFSLYYAKRTVPNKR